MLEEVKAAELLEAANAAATLAGVSSTGTTSRHQTEMGWASDLRHTCACCRVIYSDGVHCQERVASIAHNDRMRRIRQACARVDDLASWRAIG